MDCSDKNWDSVQGLSPRSYVCGHCGNRVGPDKGYRTREVNSEDLGIYLCSWCRQPTFFNESIQVPGVAYGDDVEHLPDELAALYREARNCMAASAYTSAVLTCRKLLMSIAVSQGAEEGRPFVHYVEHLATNGYVPPNGRGWVDHIRRRGNEANHEITLMTRTDAEELITFLEILLKFVHEFPARVPPSS